MSLPETTNAKFVSIIPHSGIQFLDFGFDLNLHRISPMYTRVSEKSGNLLRRVNQDETFGGYLDEDGRKVSEDNLLSVNLPRALEAYVGKWLPLPLLRVAEETKSGSIRLERGPLNWARVRFTQLAEPDLSGFTHRVTVIVDTNLLDTLPNRPYAAPSKSDVMTGAQFMLANRMSDLDFLIEDSWGESIIEDANDTYLMDRYGPKRFESAKANQEPGLAFAFYAALMDFLSEIGLIPRFVFTDTVSEPIQYQPVNVDFVLDIGNSRTCGILIESGDSDDVDLNNSYSLELRDLSSAEVTYQHPFPSMIEFHRETFGNNRLTQRSRGDAFSWPTPARVGWEANRLFNAARDTDGQTGMSSPKRYLWDTREQSHDWFFNSFGSGGERPGRSPAIRGAFFQSITNSGEEWDKSDPDSACATQASYSRSSMMMFYIAEVIAQALMQINSYSQRSRRSNTSLPRRLNRIVLTMPTAMALSERKLFERRAGLAKKRVMELLKVPPDDTPELILKWDEATGTQAVFLYNEVKLNFRGESADFFSASSRFSDPDRHNRLRVASIDVGGGTTDLIITTYSLQDGDLITPVQEIHEGFNLAGDDIVRTVIEGHVLPCFEKYIEQSGVAEPKMLLASLFGESRANEDEREHLRRRLFSNQILIPVALRIISLYEHYDVSHGESAYTLKFLDIFDEESRPTESVMTYLKSGIETYGGVPLDFESIEFPIDLNVVDSRVSRLMGDVLGDLCELINHYSCDYVLLSGRPSMMPGVYNTVKAKLPVPVDRIISMHNYKVGAWYPFRDLRGRLSDPKTTAAVGAMICALSNGYLVGFNMKSDVMNPGSTARYIGRMDDSSQIKNTNLCFADINLEGGSTERNGASVPESGEVLFSGPMFIGFRQMNVERWPGTLMYRMDFADRSEAKRLNLPLRITLERIPEEDEAKKDFKLFEIESIEDADGMTLPRSLVRFRLQTLRNDQGYWMDTGSFDVDV
ncbi:MAG: virulence factor SrfB [Gammaproteobacteria bacterium]|nr:virulence factor SrfB [Gammaproteobacteria bacterium]